MESWVNSRTVKERAAIYKDMALTYHYGHEKGICNNDIKPDNIVQSLHDPNKFIVIDLGVSCSLTGVCGLGFKAFRGVEAYTKFSLDETTFRGYAGADVWAFLMTMYYMETDVNGFGFPLRFSKCEKLNSVSCHDAFLKGMEANRGTSPLAEMAVRMAERPLEKRKSMLYVVEELDILIDPEKFAKGGMDDDGYYHA